MAGNYIGVDATGAVSLGNAGFAVEIYGGSYANVIGWNGAADAVDERNILSGNGAGGVSIHDAGTTQNVVAGNYIGTTASGAAALANNGDGVIIGSGATANTVGGTTAAARNVISGNAGDGVEITGSGTTSNVVEGNYIGTNAAGMAALPNGGHGVDIVGAANVTVGGATAGAGNIISGNTGDGVLVSNSTGTVIQGNDIGLNAAGTGPVANFDGVGVFSSGDALIGGAAAGARNVISGNARSGVLTDGAVIQGNYIGTDATGMALVANASFGILADGQGLVVGGTASGAGNVIVGNSGLGIQLQGTAHGAVIQGNLIGTDRTGNAALGGLGDDIFLTNSASGNTIGGAVAGAGNVLVGASQYGIELAGAADGTTIQGNNIGVGLDGATLIPNAGGIWIGTANNVVGGTAAGAANIIVGSVGSLVFGVAGDGVEITGQQGATGGTVVEGNIISGNGAGYAVAIESGAQADVSGFVTGNVFNDGVLSLHGLGFLDITGNYTQTANGSLVLDLGGTDPGSFDQLVVSGTVTLAGDLWHAAPRSPASRSTVADSDAVITFLSSTGAFASPAL